MDDSRTLPSGDTLSLWLQVSLTGKLWQGRDDYSRVESQRNTRDEHRHLRQTIERVTLPKGGGAWMNNAFGKGECVADDDEDDEDDDDSYMVRVCRWTCNTLSSDCVPESGMGVAQLSHLPLVQRVKKVSAVFLIHFVALGI